MSRRSRPIKVRLHVHCESCYSRRCRARVEPSVSCALKACRLLCGAVFHLCKEEEHSLLCPNERVPCLNAQYGCPLAVTRAGRAAHLRTCPASVVCCSMEWNRWPADDAHTHRSAELHDNLLREEVASLDLALALRDQDHLFHALKMKELFPELIQGAGGGTGGPDVERRAEKRRKDQEEKVREARADAAGRGHNWEAMSWMDNRPLEAARGGGEGEEEVEEEPELSQEEREALARASNVDAELLQSYAAWERMFSMEMGGCREAGSKGRGVAAGRGSHLAGEATGTAATHTASSSSSSSSSRSPVGLPTGSFTYTSVEPLKIITVRTFAIPTSFKARQGRIRNPGFYKKESHAVDTSDLGVGMEDMPVWEEVQASLLCSLEKEQRGHLIAEGTCTDALLQDEGTQTYNFLSAPFRSAACLADLTAGRPPELHLQLQLESVTGRHHKACSAFTFLCGHTFRREEYATHFRNVHSDIQTCVSGWFEQRCPLAYLGCTYSQRRFQPSTHEATVTYNQEMSCFSLRPTVERPGSPTAPPTAHNKRGGGGGGGEDSLSTLPHEVLRHVASFLDSLSLSQLALVSRLLRDVCSSLLQDRGMVSLRWEKICSHGGAKWRVQQKVWQFSTLFSPVSEWCFQDVPSMSEHLKVCPYYQREQKTQRVLLPYFKEDFQTKTLQRSPTQVNAFQNEILSLI